MQAVKKSITVETVINRDDPDNHYVGAVELTGVAQLHPETIRDLSQEAIDSTYGTIDHRRIAIFTHEDWQNMRRDEPDKITVPVHTF